MDPVFEEWFGAASLDPLVIKSPSRHACLDIEIWSSVNTLVSLISLKVLEDSA